LCLSRSQSLMRRGSIDVAPVIDQTTAQAQ
jgi:hypothetical protein